MPCTLQSIYKVQFVKSNSKLLQMHQRSYEPVSPDQNDDDALEGFYIAREIHQGLNPDYSQSRSEIRQQIAQFPAHQSFDISSFTQSRTAAQLPSKHIRQKFPYSNAPTLDPYQSKHKGGVQIHEDLRLQNEEDSNFKNENNIQAKQKRIQSLMARVAQLQEQNQSLKTQVLTKDNQFERFISKIKSLNDENIKLEQENLKKEAIIESMQNKMKGYEQKYKQILTTFKNSRNVSIDDPTSCKSSKRNSQSAIALMNSTSFSPELMSPDQCVELFVQLTLKIEKSYKIQKRLAKSQQTKEILWKILKQQ